MGTEDPEKKPEKKTGGSTGFAGPGGFAARYSRSLSSQLLLLTVIFVMAAEVLIFFPSIANFRLNWLEQRLANAQIASLALEATPDNMVSSALQLELLKNAEAYAIVLHRDATRRLILTKDNLPEIDAGYDTRERFAPVLIWDALEVLFAGDGRTIRVIGEPRFMGGDVIDLVIDETPLRQAMIGYGINIFTLSLVISVITAGLLFFALNRFLVRPLRRISENMVAFREKPEDIRRVITASGRRDEIGVAESELEAMQRQIRSTLNQQARLAALGGAVSKINHDLRNILTNAQLISDRIAGVSDPTVQKLGPRLFGSIDRAIDLCEKTLKFGKAEEDPPERRFFLLANLMEELTSASGLDDEARIAFVCDVPKDLRIHADPDQLFRILLNLVRNAAQALQGGDGEIKVRAWLEEDDKVEIEVWDNGPGLPERARKHLFQAFAGSARAGGTGLGLAICAELAEAHGGKLMLMESVPGKTVFRVCIPQDTAAVKLAAQ
jgi:signal transduction histidine kinase